MSQWVLGVDLGTSFSAGAVSDGGAVELLEIFGDRRIPSTVLLTEEGRLLAGTHAQREIGRLPDRAERNPKRYIGRPPMLLGGEPVTAVDALAALLELFVNEAQRRHDGTDPARVVVTHPVAWTDGQRAELRAAAEKVLPGIDIALLDEPVAAAVHYVTIEERTGQGIRRSGNLAVYDLGGGTFDTAVLAADNDGFRVVGRPGGDPDIGGESFDQLVYRHFGAQLEHAAPEWWEQVRSNPERKWLAASADLLTEARMAKEALSEYPTTSKYVPGADADVHLSRDELDDLIGDDVRRTVALLAETIEVAGGELSAVFLTGGASRTPLVEQILRATYAGLVRTWQDPKTVVALGAAHWALRGSPVGRPAAAAQRSDPPGSVAHRSGQRGSVSRRPGEAGSVQHRRGPSGSLAHRQRGSVGPGLPGAGPEWPGAVQPGAAQPATVVRTPGPGTPPSGTAGSQGRPPQVLVTLAEAVLDARPAHGAVFTVSIPAGPNGRHRVSRRDATTGRVEREFVFGDLAAWAVSDAGVVIAERHPGGLRCHILDSYLTLRSSIPLQTRIDPSIVIEGETAWVLQRAVTTRNVGAGDGMGWGELGDLAVQVLRLGPGPRPPSMPAPPLSMGQAAYWYIDENGRRRRLIDPTAPSTAVPAALGDDRSCAMIIGRVTPEGPPRAGQRRREVHSQSVGRIGPSGTFTPIVEQRVRDTATPWVHQVIQPGGGLPWLLATSVGLEMFGDLRTGAGRLLFLPRPTAGAVRWVRAGRQAYGLAVGKIMPGRDLSLHALVDGRCQDLGRWHALLGSPTSVRRAEVPCVRVDGEQIWVGVGDGAGGSHLVRADHTTAQVAASAPGWLEPVGRVGDTVLALHAPGTRPGDARKEAGLLVRLGS